MSFKANWLNYSFLNFKLYLWISPSTLWLLVSILNARLPSQIRSEMGSARKTTTKSFSPNFGVSDITSDIAATGSPSMFTKLCASQLKFIGKTTGNCFAGWISFTIVSWINFLPLKFEGELFGLLVVLKTNVNRAYAHWWPSNRYVEYSRGVTVSSLRCSPSAKLLALEFLHVKLLLSFK